jgi:hypothetical protein
MGHGNITLGLDGRRGQCNSSSRDVKNRLESLLAIVGSTRPSCVLVLHDLLVLLNKKLCHGEIVTLGLAGSTRILRKSTIHTLR